MAGDCARQVVVVDDDEDIRETLRDLLVDQGFNVVVARDGREALVLLDGITPCMMLVDLMMPVMDGWELLRQLELKPHVAFPIYVSTSAPERAPAGFPVLPKPVDVGDLLALLKRHCS